MAAGLSGLVTCLQSNLIGPNLHGLFFKLGRSALPLFLTGRILIGWLQVTWWGRGIPPFQKKQKPRSRPPASPGNPAVERDRFIALPGNGCFAALKQSMLRCSQKWCPNRGGIGEYLNQSSRVELLIRLRYVQGLHTFNLVSGGLLILMSISGSFNLASGISWLLLLCVCILSLPWLAAVWTCPLELKEGQEGRNLTTTKNRAQKKVSFRNPGYCWVLVLKIFSFSLKYSTFWLHFWWFN